MEKRVVRAIPSPREPPRNRLGRDGPAGDLTKKNCVHIEFIKLYSYLLVRVRQEWSN